MKKILLPCLFSLQILSSCKSQPVVSPAIGAADSGGFAVVELFTSQGCSSCPPADNLLGKEITANTKAGKKMIALSFHVDYWNRLGWTDPFSQHIFSERQYGYSARMKADGVYTPQVVVNGQSETVGGNQAKIENFINQSLAEKPTATIAISAAGIKGNNLEITCTYNGPATDLNIAIVQHRISTPVEAGENDGRTLTNYNVVRSWKTITAQNGSQTIAIAAPAGYNKKDFSIVIYAQDKDYGKILNAAFR